MGIARDMVNLEDEVVRLRTELEAVTKERDVLAENLRVNQQCALEDRDERDAQELEFREGIVRAVGLTAADTDGLDDDQFVQAVGKRVEDLKKLLEDPEPIPMTEEEQKEFDACMSKSKEEVEAELRALGIDPEKSVNEVLSGVINKLGHDVFTQRVALDAAAAKFNALKDAVVKYIEHYNLEHEDECPEDDTCECALVQNINKALGEYDG